MKYSGNAVLFVLMCFSRASSRLLARSVCRGPLLTRSVCTGSLLPRSVCADIVAAATLASLQQTAAGSESGTMCYGMSSETVLIPLVGSCCQGETASSPSAVTNPCHGKRGRLPGPSQPTGFCPVSPSHFSFGLESSRMFASQSCSDSTAPGGKMRRLRLFS